MADKNAHKTENKAEVKKTAEVAKPAEKKIVRVKALKTLRTVYGAYDKGYEYDIPAEYAAILCKDGRCEECS